MSIISISIFDPPVWIGITFAVFKAVGKVPSSIDALIMSAITWLNLEFAEKTINSTEVKLAEMLDID